MQNKISCFHGIFTKKKLRGKILPIPLFNIFSLIEFSLQFGPNDYGGGGIETLAFGQPILRRDMKIRIVENLAEYFGDSNTRNIILREYDPDNGRVVWNNKSLAALPCNSQEVSWVRR